MTMYSPVVVDPCPVCNGDGVLTEEVVDFVCPVCYGEGAWTSETLELVVEMFRERRARDLADTSYLQMEDEEEEED